MDFKLWCNMKLIKTAVVHINLEKDCIYGLEYKKYMKVLNYIIKEGK